jgi:hypothetical protein
MRLSMQGTNGHKPSQPAPTPPKARAWSAPRPWPADSLKRESARRPVGTVPSASDVTDEAYPKQQGSKVAAAYIDVVADRVDPGLSESERAILACGLVEWGGPASPTDAIAHLLGFADKQALFDEGRAIAHALRSGEPITPGEWRRALMATEIVFASDLVGSGIDWAATTGSRTRRPFVRCVASNAS